MKNVNESKKIVFWEYIGTDAEGDITIKIKSKKAQAELRALVEKADAKLAKELEDKKKRIEAVTLEEAEEFDSMVAELINSDAIYVKAGKMTGRNLVVDWDKIDGKKNNTDKKQGKQKKQLEAIRVDATFEF
jgi:hypothetical protein